MNFNLGNASDSQIIQGVASLELGVATFHSGAFGVINLPGAGAANDFAD